MSARKRRVIKGIGGAGNGDRPDPTTLIQLVWRSDGSYDYRWWPGGPITKENAEVVVAGVLREIAEQITAGAVVRHPDNWPFEQAEPCSKCGQRHGGDCPGPVNLNG